MENILVPQQLMTAMMTEELDFYNLVLISLNNTICTNWEDLFSEVLIVISCVIVKFIGKYIIKI